MEHPRFWISIDVITPEKLRQNNEALAWLQDKQADFLVVVAFEGTLPFKFGQSGFSGFMWQCFGRYGRA